MDKRESIGPFSLGRRGYKNEGQREAHGCGDSSRRTVAMLMDSGVCAEARGVADQAYAINNTKSDAIRLVYLPLR